MQGTCQDSAAPDDVWVWGRQDRGFRYDALFPWGSRPVGNKEVSSYSHTALPVSQEASKGQVHRPQVIPRTGGEAAGCGVQI